jgi:guanyl-specific ribonuclease Sa
MGTLKRLLVLLAAATLALPAPALAKAKTIRVDAAQYAVNQSGTFTAMEEVAVYLSVYGRLPYNFITKRAAQALGWDSRAGNLNEVAPGQSIGGDRFGNYEGTLPDAQGRTWTECDIDADGGYRNGQRIVFSSDGLLYYTDDHYETFAQIIVEGSPAEAASPSAAEDDKIDAMLDEHGAYTAAGDVAAYLYRFGRLPGNYLTRDEAKALGWSAKKNNLGDVAPGSAIGGDSFGNREGLLPDAEGRRWFECDVDTVDGARSDHRLVFSSDGLIYFSPDAHRSFARLY